MDLRLTATMFHTFTTAKMATLNNLHISLLVSVVMCYKCSRNPLLYLSVSRSSSRWDFHFHSYMLTIYVRLY